MMERWIGSAEVEFPEAEVVPVYVEGRQIKGWVAVVNARTREVYNIPTDSYTLVQHKTVYEIALDELEKTFGKVESNVTFTHRGARMYARFLIDKWVEVRNNDPIRPGFLVTNSYDGSMGIWIAGYFFRKVCSNGLVMPTEILKVHTIHVSKEEDSLQARIRARIEEIVDALDETIELFRAATMQKISWKEAVDIIENFPISKSHKEKIKQILIKDTGIQPVPEAEVSIWDLYNAFTADLTHNVRNMEYHTALQLNARAARQVLVLARQE